MLDLRFVCAFFGHDDHVFLFLLVLQNSHMMVVMMTFDYGSVAYVGLRNRADVSEAKKEAH